MEKRYRVGLIYLLIVCMTLLLRISGALDIYGALGVDGDVFFTLVVQLLIFGVMPLALYRLLGTNDAVTVTKIEVSLAYAGAATKQNVGVTEVGADARSANDKNSDAFDKTSKRKAVDKIKGYFISFEETALTDFGFTRKLTLKDFFRTVAISLIMIFTATGLSYFWQVVLYYSGYTPVSSSTDYSNIGVLFAELALTALLPAVFEETTHRGLLFAGYRDSGVKVVFVSALLFALMHQNIRQTGYTFYDGLIMALTVYYTRSIYAGMIIHFMNNALAVIQGYISQNGGAFEFINRISDWFFGSLFGILAYIVLGAGLILLMVWLFKRMRRDSLLRGDITIDGNGSKDAVPLHRDAYFIVTVIIGIAATVFSYVWGFIR